MTSDVRLASLRLYSLLAVQQDRAGRGGVLDSRAWGHGRGQGAVGDSCVT